MSLNSFFTLTDILLFLVAETEKKKKKVVMLHRGATDQELFLGSNIKVLDKSALF